MANNFLDILKSLFIYIYLFSIYAMMVYYFSYLIEISLLPFAILYYYWVALTCIILFCLINHLILKKAVPIKNLIIIESLLLYTVYAIFFSKIVYSL